jgi:hypothetical protein
MIFGLDKIPPGWELEKEMVMMMSDMLWMASMCIIRLVYFFVVLNFELLLLCKKLGL